MQQIGVILVKWLFNQNSMPNEIEIASGKKRHRNDG